VYSVPSTRTRAWGVPLTSVMSRSATWVPAAGFCAGEVVGVVGMVPLVSGTVVGVVSTVVPPSEPPVFAEPREFEVHGVRLRDDFAWLKAANWMDVLKDPAVLPPRIRAHLEAENAFSQAVLAGAAPLCEQIVAEMRGRIKEDDWTVPEVDGAFAYSTRYREGGQHPLGLGLADAVHHRVVHIPLEPDARKLSGHPYVERVVHEQVRQDRRNRGPL